MYNLFIVFMVLFYNILVNFIGLFLFVLVFDVFVGSYDLFEDNRKLLDKLMFILINCEEKLFY